MAKDNAKDEDPQVQVRGQDDQGPVKQIAPNSNTFPNGISNLIVMLIESQPRLVKRRQAQVHQKWHYF